MGNNELIQYLSRSGSITGSFLVSPSGSYLAGNLPEFFDSTKIPSMAEDGYTALEAIRTKLPAAKEIRLDTHLVTIFLRDLGRALLVVLVKDSSKANSAKIAIDVVARRYLPEGG
ncbi:hypothetical protein N9A94_08450 [Akkermansiaceae bacterium]|nr:hypothetical protein [Akkermansiaceae bacterium]MDB4537932.1 hypothetical protein [Akkermansiaceae bacterium]